MTKRPIEDDADLQGDLFPEMPRGESGTSAQRAPVPMGGKAVSSRPGKAKPTPTERVEREMRRIAEIEHLIEEIEEQAPRRLAGYRDRIHPLLEKVADARQSLLAILENSLGHLRRNARRQRGTIVELILHVAEGLEERFGRDMDAVFERYSQPEGEPLSEEELHDVELEMLRDFVSFATGSKPTREELEAMRQAMDSELEREREAEQKREERETTRKPQPGSKGAQDPAQTVRSLYLGLARDLHPDKAREDEERARRTELMKDLTTAYREGDLKALLGLLRERPEGADSWKEMDDKALRSCLRGLERQRKELERTFSEIRQGAPFPPYDWEVFLRSPDAWEIQLKSAERSVQRERRDILELVERFRDPEAIRRFIREVPPEAWEMYL